MKEIVSIEQGKLPSQMLEETMTPKEKAFERLGFGNLNVLKLPHTIINMEAKELGEAIDIALQEQAKQIKLIIIDLAYQKKDNKLIRKDINHLDVLKRIETEAWE